ncbi:hypothetical protein ILUMI_03848 [Ignelater luminosus]|uniref:PiggyBac transposable element-derived protein domain-containing protein n=1 Tax=Ignelater luminosus TaxID=2038154 RepID=A0A8K0GLS1_IGNLU|nr:hypothetical protein ILUMI_03848 [Ignelater luminosus]
MAGRSSVRVTDEGAESILLQWFEECNLRDSDEENCAEVRSEYNSENTSDAESSISSNNGDYQPNLYMRLQIHNKRTTSLWDVEDGRPIFNKTISRNRFTTISQCLRFDNAEARRRNRDPDKL